MDIRHILEQSRQDDLVQTALETAIEQIARLLAVAVAAADVAKDAYYSEEGGPHHLVDAEIIQRLDSALAAVEDLL